MRKPGGRDDVKVGLPGDMSLFSGFPARFNSSPSFEKCFLIRHCPSAMVNHMVKCSPQMLDRTFSALADPTRRKILAELANGERCVTDLARPHRMSLPAVSKHLRVLERAGLVRRHRCGRVHSLKLETKPMQQAQAWIESYRRFWEQSFDRLDDYLKELQAKETTDESKL